MKIIGYTTEGEASNIITDMTGRGFRLSAVSNLITGDSLGFEYLTSDKYFLNADGVDVATITASEVSGPVIFSVNGSEQLPAVNSAGGVATFQFSTTLPGDFTIEARSDLDGNSSVIVKGV